MKKEDKNNVNNDIEIILGDNSNLNFSDVKDCVNALLPKSKEKLKKKIVIPKEKK